MTDEAPVRSDALVALTTDIIAAYVSHNPVSPDVLPALIASTHAALATAGSAPTPEPEESAIKLTPAQIRKSITPDALISFVDGKPYRTLKRHLAVHGMTLEDYRKKYGLPSDYPSVAPSYSAARSALAKATGLGAKGRKPGKKTRTAKR